VRPSGKGATIGYVLYGTRLTGTCAVQAALEEVGASYEHVEISTRKGDHLNESYRAINPRQQVPSLRLPDGCMVTEGPAMLLHIADAHPQSRLAPTPGSSQRALHDRWLIFFAVNVYEGELRKLFGQRYTSDPAAASSVQESAVAYVNRHYALFEPQLVRGPYFFGDELTVLDIYVWMLSQWLDADWLAQNCPPIAALAANVAARPKIAPIHLDNFGT
jgi:glutathione S-transferase